MTQTKGPMDMNAGETPWTHRLDRSSGRPPTVRTAYTTMVKPA